MRVLQLIDSLEPGGAERMAVNYANCLSERITFSALIATRNVGGLSKEVSSKTHFFFLQKKSTLDIKAVLRLRNFVLKNKISIVHAHGSSYFTAFLLKLVCFKIKLVWHDHNGNRADENNFSNRILQFCSYFFASVIVVNHGLESWAKKRLKAKKIIYFPNFTVKNTSETKTTYLKGVDDKRIVCVSNLRNPKNHLKLLSSFVNSKIFKEGWTLHFIGRDYNDAYSDAIKNFVSENKIDDFVFVYGSCPDIYFILEQATIGVLASYYEGFPVVLLEYGLSKLPVISTNVGYCKEIINDRENGLLFDPNDTESLKDALKILTSDITLQRKFGSKLSADINDNFSDEKIIEKIIKLYHSL